MVQRAATIAEMGGGSEEAGREGEAELRGERDHVRDRLKKRKGRRGASSRCHVRVPAPPNRESINFHNSRSLDDRGFLLPVGKLLGAIPIDINASKLFAVRVIHGYLPMMVLAPLVALHAAGLLEPLLSHDEWVPPLWGLWQVWKGRASNKLEVNVRILDWVNAMGLECQFGGIKMKKQGAFATFARIQPYK